jgi:hypothetical protein
VRNWIVRLEGAVWMRVRASHRIVVQCSRGSFFYNEGMRFEFVAFMISDF